MKGNLLGRLLRRTVVTFGRRATTGRPRAWLVVFVSLLLAAALVVACAVTFWLADFVEGGHLGAL